MTPRCPPPRDDRAAGGGKPIGTLIRRHRLLAFYGVAFALSWGYWIPVAAAGGRWSHLPGLLGPLVAALLLTAVTSGRAGLRELGERAVRWRVPLRYYATIGVLLGAALTALGLQVLVGADVPSWRELSTMPGLPDAGWFGVLVLVFLINGYGEEAGWRGFAWPELRRRHTLVGAALRLTAPWALWHVPTFWIDSGLRGFAPLMLPGFFVGMAAGAVVLGSLYERSGASLFLVALWHAVMNMVSGTSGTEGFGAAAVSIVVIFWAVRILRMPAAGGISPPPPADRRRRTGPRLRRASAGRDRPAGTPG